MDYHTNEPGIIYGVSLVHKATFWRVFIRSSFPSRYLRNYLKLQGDVYFSGRVKRYELPGLYRLAKAGLSIAPDIYPYNAQITIKTLEYLASGIGLVSNHYGWINQFSDEYNYQPLWTGSLKTKDDFDRFEFSEIDLLEFSWDNIFKNVNFNNFVDSILS